MADPIPMLLANIAFIIMDMIQATAETTTSSFVLPYARISALAGALCIYKHNQLPCMQQESLCFLV